MHIEQRPGQPEAAGQFADVDPYVIALRCVQLGDDAEALCVPHRAEQGEQLFAGQGVLLGVLGFGLSPVRRD
jgi:hypothetical protein